MHLQQDLIVWILITTQDRSPGLMLSPSQRELSKVTRTFPDLRLLLPLAHFSLSVSIGLDTHATKPHNQLHAQQF
jgi:hypothetical protein